MAWRNLPKGTKLPKSAGQSSPWTKAAVGSSVKPEPLPESAPWTHTHTTEELVDLHADYWQRRETGKPVAWAVSSARIRDIERELAERGRLDLLAEMSIEETFKEKGEE